MVSPADEMECEGEIPQLSERRVAVGSLKEISRVLESMSGPKIKGDPHICLQVQRHAEKWGASVILTPIREALLADSPQKLLRRSSSLRASVSSQVDDIVVRMKAGQALLAEQESEVQA